MRDPEASTHVKEIGALSSFTQDVRSISSTIELARFSGKLEYIHILTFPRFEDLSPFR